MAEIQAASIDRVLGWAITDDKKHALIRLAQTTGKELTLAVTEEWLLAMITSLIDATAAFPSRPGKATTKVAVKVSAFELMTGRRSLDHVLTFRLRRGGHLGFYLTGAMATQLAEGLKTVVLGETKGASSETVRN